MRALILTDFYILVKRLGIFLILVLLLAAIPISFCILFAITYAGFLPYTAMAYDERSKWDQMAAMLPYSDRDIVLSRYVLSWLCMGAAAGLIALVQGVFRFYLPIPSYRFSLAFLLLGVCGGLCVSAIALPLTFRFNTERGQAVIFPIFLLVCGFPAAAAGAVVTGPALAVLTLAAVALTAASVPLSIKMYRRWRR